MEVILKLVTRNREALFCCGCSLINICWVQLKLLAKDFLINNTFCQKTLILTVISSKTSIVLAFDCSALKKSLSVWLIAKKKLKKKLPVPSNFVSYLKRGLFLLGKFNHKNLLKFLKKKLNLSFRP